MDQELLTTRRNARPIRPMKTYVSRLPVSDHGFPPHHRFVEGHTDSDGFCTESIDVYDTTTGRVVIRCSLTKYETKKFWDIEFFDSGNYIVYEWVQEVGPARQDEEITIEETPESKAAPLPPTQTTALEDLLQASVDLTKKGKKK